MTLHYVAEGGGMGMVGKDGDAGYLMTAGRIYEQEAAATYPSKASCPQESHFHYLGFTSKGSFTFQVSHSW